MLKTTEKYYITLDDVKMLYDYKLQYLLRDESQMRSILYQGNEKSENLKMICEIFWGEYGRDNKMFEILHLIDTNTLKQIHEARLTYKDRNRKQLNYFEDLVLKNLKNK